jgi:thiopurine S-methyltransferase
VAVGKGGHEHPEGKKITLLTGDFFDLDETVTGGRFEAIVDRASLVAIQPTLREVYVQIMSKVIKAGGNILLVTIERRSGTDADMSGPPFSVPEAEVRRLYENQDWVESVTLLEDQGEMARNEGTTMASLYFLIQAK